MLTAGRLLHCADERHVVIARTRVHQRIAIRAERFGRVDAVAKVYDPGLSVGIEKKGADVVVVVAFAVVPSLGSQIHPP